MFVQTRQTAFCPNLSPTDWAMISTALGAYTHNAEYRDLVQRLDQQMTRSAPWTPAGQPTAKIKAR
ncbi:hypothetical protein [Paracoccus gahaiensis]|uniref:hypothetical protein n=1 Tax=Paracoccus gahaiensis TaxID=1706839 RepID=UPI0010AE6155|nr:hypothetical protein [Paracoccus gahaiensis]